VSPEPSQETFEAVVTDVRLESTTARGSIWRIALDHTDFVAGDTGQFEAQARSGARLIIPVLRVEADPSGTLWHVVEKPLNEGTKIVAKRMRERSSLVHS
jgi:hypothetical protein